jgi:hypothetical protein
MNNKHHISTSQQTNHACLRRLTDNKHVSRSGRSFVYAPTVAMGALNIHVIAQRGAFRVGTTCSVYSPALGLALVLARGPEQQQ